MPTSKAVNSRLTRNRSCALSPAIPSAAATANVSSPSGTIRPTSLSSTAPNYTASVTALELIREKRDGQAHTDEAIRFLVSGASDGTIPDYQLAAWLMAVRLRGMSDRETATLTLAMAASGRQLDLSSIPGKKVDKHSTGGVGGKATPGVAALVASTRVPVGQPCRRGLRPRGGAARR